MSSIQGAGHGWRAELLLLLLVLVVASSEGDAWAAEAEERPVRILELSVEDRIEADGLLVRTQRQVTELLTPAGAQAYSQMGIVFFESNQTASFVEISVTKRDGRRIDLLANAPTDVTSALPANLPIYSDLRVLRAAVPRLDVGDRVVSITESRVRPLTESHVWTEALFATPLLPELMSYVLDLPERSALRVWVRPDFEARSTERKEGGRWVRRWEVQRAGAESAPDEEKSTPEIQVSSFASWDRFASWWYSLAPPVIDDAIRSKATELTAGLDDPVARLAAIHRFAAQEVQYLALPLGIGRYQARDPEAICVRASATAKTRFACSRAWRWRSASRPRRCCSTSPANASSCRSSRARISSITSWRA